MLVKSSVKTLLRSMPARDRVAFVKANEKLCEDLVSGASRSQLKTKSKCGCKKGETGCKDSNRTRKEKATKKLEVQSSKKKKREEKGKKNRPQEKGKEKEHDEEDIRTLAEIERAMHQLQEQWSSIIKKRSPSPRESSKGQKTRSQVSDQVKVKEVEEFVRQPRKRSCLQSRIGLRPLWSMYVMAALVEKCKRRSRIPSKLGNKRRARERTESLIPDQRRGARERMGMAQTKTKGTTQAATARKVVDQKTAVTMQGRVLGRSQFQRRGRQRRWV